jgi:MFS family permease
MFNVNFSIGIGVGMSSSPAAVYAAEISHPSLRGRLTLLSAMCTAIGMLFIYTLGYVIPVSGRAFVNLSYFTVVISIYHPTD